MRRARFGWKKCFGAAAVAGLVATGAGQAGSVPGHSRIGGPACVPCPPAPIVPGMITPGMPVPYPTPNTAPPITQTPGTPGSPPQAPTDPLDLPPAVPPEQPAADPGPDFDLASDSTLALGGGDVALAPNMIGDLQGGGCGGLSFGGLLRVLIEHPTFGCSRLNIAENNSPLPRDRVYFRYNHFDQETLTDVFTDTPRGAASAVDLDRYTFGFEKTFFDGRFSTELRVPVNRQFVNTIDLQDTQGRTNLPLESRNTVFGNLGLTLKLLLLREEKLKLSTGVGVNIPTERSVKINVRVRNDQFVLNDPEPAFPNGRTAPVIAGVSGVVKNETVNLSPFLAALYTPTDRLFAQGFIQVDVPVNKSNANVSGFTFIDVPGIGPISNDIPFESGFLKQQVLMRLDLGGGYFVYKNPNARWITGFAPTMEAHYSFTVSDASTLTLPLEFFPGSSADLVVGNLSNRVDVFNLTFGATALLGNRGTFALGYVVPLSTGDNKPFEYEISAQLNWYFGNTTGRGTRVGFN